MAASDAVPASTVILPVEPKDPGPATLQELVDTLGPHALQVVEADPRLLERPVGEPIVHGVGEPVEDVRDGLVLLTGARSRRSETIDAVLAAAGGGAQAVVIKAWDDGLVEISRQAKGAGIALLRTPDEMAWRHLDALVTAARAAAARVGDDGAQPHLPGDLFALANAIAGSLGGAVTLEDPAGRVLAYSNLPGQEIDEIRRLAILGRQTPDRPTNAEEYRTIAQSAGPVLFSSSRSDYASRMAVAVRAGHQVLGVIFVLCDRPPLVDNAESVLADAARAAALHFLRARGDHDPDRARRSDVLRAMVTGELRDAALGSVLGAAANAPFVLAVARPASPLGPREVDAVRVTDLVTLHGEYWHSGTVSTVLSGQILLLLPVDEDERHNGDAAGHLDARLHQLGSSIVTAVRRSMQVDLRIACAPVTHDLSELPAVFGYAERILGALEQGWAGNATVATLDDVRSEVILSTLTVDPDLVGPALLLPEVRAVLDHDARQGTDYAETLLTYLRMFGDVVATAKRLNIHVNTARYRVRRLAEVFGIDPASSDRTLVIWLQLQALAGDGAGSMQPSEGSSGALSAGTTRRPRIER